MKNQSSNGARGRTSAPPEAIYPIILAAGRWQGLLTGAALSREKARTWIRTAVANCAGLAPPVVVLGWCADVLTNCVPKDVTVIVNGEWEHGQITSLLAGLRYVPEDAALMIYPVDLHLLRKDSIEKLVAAYRSRRRGREIVMPMYREHAGHPAILSGKLRKELEAAETARHVVYRDPRRVSFVETDCAAVLHKSGPRVSPVSRGL